MKDSQWYQNLSAQLSAVKESAAYKKFDAFNEKTKESSWYKKLSEKHEELKKNALYRKLFPDTNNPKFYPILTGIIVIGLFAWWTEDSSNDFRQYASYDLIGGQGYTQTSLTNGNGMKRAEIVDQSGFKRPMVASTILVPESWQTQGGVFWPMNRQGCGLSTPHTNWQATAPDGISSVGIIPEHSWTGNSFGIMGNQCPNVMLGNIQQFLEFFVRQYRQGARILEFRPRPDIVAPLRHLARNTSMGMEQSRTWFESGQMILEYQVGGTTVNELVALLVMFHHSNTGNAQMQVASAMPGFSYRAPKGQLDTNYAEQIRLSIRANPEYQKAKAGHNSTMSSIALEGGRKRGEIINNGNQEVMRINQEGYEKRNRIRAEGDRRFNEMMRETNRYVDPSTGNNYELSQNQQFHWLLDDGRVVSTNDAFFLPYRDVGVQGRRLERRP